MIRKNIKGKIKEFYFTYPTEKLRARALERRLKLPFPSVLRYLKELVSEDFLLAEVIGGVKFYTANRTSRRFLLEKRLYNVKILFECGLVDFLIDEYSNPTIVLFGSYSKGEDVENSDIDIYVETRSRRILSLKKFEQKLHRSIQLFKYVSFAEIKNQMLKNSIINGIVLNGYLEVFK